MPYFSRMTRVQHIPGLRYIASPALRVPAPPSHMIHYDSDMNDVMRHVVYTCVHRLNRQFGGGVMTSSKVNLVKLEQEASSFINDIQGRVNPNLSARLHAMKTDQNGMNILARFSAYECIRLRAEAQSKPITPLISDHFRHFLDRHGTLFRPDRAALRISENSLMDWLVTRIEKPIPRYDSAEFHASPIIDRSEMLPAYESGAFYDSPVIGPFDAPAPHGLWPQRRL